MDARVETHSGRMVHFNNPSPEQITFGDIAWSLSRQSRYNGHTQGEFPYSVSQHSVWVAFIAQHWFDADRLITLQALFHDAHEAYTGDITSPLKYIPELHVIIKPIEDRLQKVIHESFLLPEPTDDAKEIIKMADEYALAVEAHHLMATNGKGWACMKNLPSELLSFFWRPLPTQEAHELFWMAKNYIDRGFKLEELWRSI